MSTFKTSFVGNLINELSSGRLLKLPDQKQDFRVPKIFLGPRSDLDLGALEKDNDASQCTTMADTEVPEGKPLANDTRVAKICDEESGKTEREKKDEGETKEKRIDPNGDEVIIVDWYDGSDQENPQ